jgi:hypothetical protein
LERGQQPCWVLSWWWRALRDEMAGDGERERGDKVGHLFIRNIM